MNVILASQSPRRRELMGLFRIPFTVKVADVDEKKRKGDISSVAGNIGNADNSKPLDLTGVKVYESGFDLIHDPNVDMVDICVPTPYHADLVKAAIAAKKYVFSEKPLCRNLEEASELAKAVKSATIPAIKAEKRWLNL